MDFELYPLGDSDLHDSEGTFTVQRAWHISFLDGPPHNT